MPPLVFSNFSFRPSLFRSQRFHRLQTGCLDSGVHTKDNAQRHREDQRAQRDSHRRPDQFLQQQSAAHQRQHRSQHHAEDAADAEKQLLQMYSEAEAGLNGARLISEKDVSDVLRTNTYEISKGLTATGTYLRGDDGEWAL